jgi:hypothetical protein
MPHYERHIMSEIVTPVPTPPSEPATPVVAKANEELGEGGIKALQAERDARVAAEKRLKEIEDRDKSEAEKAAERLAQAEKRSAELETQVVRAEVAASKSVPAVLLAGPASGSAADLATFADALIAFRGEPQAQSLRVPKEGNSPRPQASDEKEFIRSLFAAGKN